MLEADVEKIKAELTSSQNEVKELTAKLAKAETEIDALVDVRQRTEDNLRQAHKEREKAVTAAALAEQGDTLRQEIIGRLEKQLESLMLDIVNWKTRATELQRQLDGSQTSLQKTNNERIEELKHVVQIAKKLQDEKEKKNHRRDSKQLSTPPKP